MTCSHLSSFGERALNGFDKTNKCVQFIFNRASATSASASAPAKRCDLYDFCSLLIFRQLTQWSPPHDDSVNIFPILSFNWFDTKANFSLWTFYGSGLAPHAFFLHSTLPLHFSCAHTFICCYLIFWWQFRSNGRNKREIYKAGLFEMNYSSRLVMHVCIVRFVCWWYMHFRTKVLLWKMSNGQQIEAKNRAEKKFVSNNALAFTRTQFI